MIVAGELRRFFGRQHDDAAGDGETALDARFRLVFAGGGRGDGGRGLVSADVDGNLQNRQKSVGKQHRHTGEQKQRVAATPAGRRPCQTRTRAGV